MEIDELKKRKMELEVEITDKIFQLCKNFQKETNISIKGILIQFESVLSNNWSVEKIISETTVSLDL